MKEQMLIEGIVWLSGVLVGALGGRVLPLLRGFVKKTPTKVDDVALGVVEKIIDEECKARDEEKK